MSKFHSLFRQIFWMVALCFCAGPASALGLGEISVKSNLGARFYAEVRLLESAGDSRVPEGCFRLSQKGDAESGMETLTHAKITIEHQNGQSKLIINSDQTINEPVLQINLRAGCGAEVVRSYTVLVDPVTVVPSTRKSIVSPPVSEKLRERAQANSAETIPQSSPDYPTEWEVIEGESARSIAKAIFPRQPGAQRRFLAALATENPQVELGRRGEILLEAGITLVVPELQRDLRRIAREKIPRENPSNLAEKQARQEAKPAESKPPEKPVVPKMAGRMSDRLVISGEETLSAENPDLSLRQSTELSTQLSGKVSESTRDMMRLEYRLLSALHDQAVQQLAIAEQVRNLEISLEEMRVVGNKVAGEAATPTAVASPEESEVPAISAPVTPPVAAVEAQPASKPDAVKPKHVQKALQENGTGWWLEIAILLSVVGALTWWLVRRSRESAALRSSDESAGEASDVESADETDLWLDEPLQKPVLQVQIPAPAPLAVPESEAAVFAPSTGMIEFSRQDIPSKHVEVDESGDYTTVLELAEIMISFGRIKGAVQALEDYIYSEPSTALAPWLKLLEIFRTNEMREEFDSYSLKLRTHFNVAPASWEEAGECLTEPITPVDENDVAIEELLQRLPTISNFPHIRDALVSSWDSLEGLDYLKHLLRDTREGKRSGFPLAIARELLFLADILRVRLLNRA